MAQEPWAMGAVELAAAIRTGQLSSREATESALSRMAAVNPALNAVVEPMIEQARAAADAADAAIARGDVLGALHGVPVTIKMNVDQTGMPRTNGLNAYRDRVATDDSPVVTNMLKAGGVVLGRTNCPAFAARGFTSNELHGATYNPFSRDVTPGGSSGGAAAAVAAGIGAVAHGNDLGGSVRQPAALCGVVGLRCTPSRIPNYNPSVALDRPYIHQSTTSQGPLARSIADARLGFEAMAGRDPRDPWWVPALPASDRPSLPARVALYLGRDDGPEPVDPVVRDALTRAALAFQAAGWVVEEAEPPMWEEALALHRSLLFAERELGTNRDIMAHGDIMVRRSMQGRAAMKPDPIPDMEAYVRAVARRSTILRAWNLFFEKYPLLLMPNAWLNALPFEYDQQGDEAVARTQWALAPHHVTALLALPGLSVPTGLHAGLPTHVQLVAGRMQDEFLFDAGQIIEDACGILTPIDPR
ncbi:amidase [Rhodovarius crocodyli]|uniref:Amidase n=1 Tax=Rhodovarius crocodyli TaxID=1979269 RepID=A0A437M3D2_9PROT|nr:amidase [Rhodovarius crocodyli]RVT92217.1 amidase [Rhodovarius crocodyli]